MVSSIPEKLTNAVLAYVQKEFGVTGTSTDDKMNELVQKNLDTIAKDIVISQQKDGTFTCEKKAWYRRWGWGLGLLRYLFRTPLKEETNFEKFFNDIKKLSIQQTPKNVAVVSILNKVAHDRINPWKGTMEKPLGTIKFNDQIQAEIENLEEQIEDAEAHGRYADAEVQLGLEQLSGLEWTLQKQPVQPTFEAFTKALVAPGFNNEKCEALCKEYGIDHWTFPGDYEDRKKWLLDSAKKLSGLPDKGRIIEYYQNGNAQFRAKFSKEFCGTVDKWSAAYKEITKPVVDFRGYLNDCRDRQGENAVGNWLNGVMGEKFMNGWLDAVKFREEAHRRLEQGIKRTWDLKVQLVAAEREERMNAARSKIVSEWEKNGFLSPLAKQGIGDTGEEVRKAIELSFAEYVKGKFKMSDLWPFDRVALKRLIKACAATWANMNEDAQRGFFGKKTLESDPVRAKLFEALSALDREIRRDVVNVGSGNEALQKYKNELDYQTPDPDVEKADKSLILGK